LKVDSIYAKGLKQEKHKQNRTI